MSNDAVNKFWQYLKSIGINPWIFTAIICVGFSMFFLTRGDLKNWKQLDNTNKMNDLLLFGAAVISVILAVLNLLGVISH